ncbi:MAG TPA: YncE family protein [Usitatibacter sp.]|nr:YncE family protein [Usitatibacter sp.]
MAGSWINLARAGVAAAALCAAAAGAAPFAYITETGIDNVRVIDTATGAVVANVSVGFVPFGIAVNPAGTRAYVTNAFDDNVSVIDAAANRVVATIAVGVRPIGVAVSPDGKRVYVANSGGVEPGTTVSVIDATTDTLDGAIDVGNGPLGLAVSPDGARLYVANLLGGSISVVDTASRATIATIGVPALPAALALDPSGARLYATESAVGAASGDVLVIDTAKNAIVTAVPVDANPLGIALDPAGTRAYVANAGNGVGRGATVSVIDLSSRAVVATIPVGRTPQGIAMHPSGARVYVANTDSDSVSVIDTASNAVIATIPAGSGPVSFGRFIVPSVLASSANYQSLWWRAPAGSESGWGLNIAHQGATLFGTWFTYGAGGSPMWLVMSNGTRIGPATYSGTLHRATGPSFDAAPWDPAQVALTAAGVATLDFSDADHGTFTYSVDGVKQSKAIVRQVFASPVPVCAPDGAAPATPNFQDLWWRAPAGSESGWGVNITHQGDVLFATWFTYGAGGKGQWLVMSNGARTGTASYSGTLFRTTGAAFDAVPWDAARVPRTAVGSATFTFTDADNGTFAYTLDGVTQAKPITRQAFASPPTICK